MTRRPRLPRRRAARGGGAGPRRGRPSGLGGRLRRPAAPDLSVLMDLGARRPVLVCVVAVLLGLGGAVFAALRLEPRTTTDTLVSRGTSEYKASADYHRKFGDDAVYVLVREPLDQLVLTSDLARLIALEGCLGGRAPASYTFPGKPHGPCDAIRTLKPAQIVYGPGTFINSAASQIAAEEQRRLAGAQQAGQEASAEAAAAARQRGLSTAAQQAAASQASQAATAQIYAQLLALANKYGLSVSDTPAYNNPGFVSKLVFETGKPAGTPKQRFAYLFPAKNAALIQIRLRPNLSARDRKRTIRLIQAAVARPEWALPHGKGSYVVTGAPVLVTELTDSISGGVRLLLGVAIAVMALVLAAVFRVRRRLLPLVVALTATGITFGLLALVGREMTIATIAVIPVVIGLAVDYAIQLQSRVLEEQRGGAGGVRTAALRVARVGAPTVLTAATATAVGFLVLLLSPVPMVRGFGVLVVVGVVVAVVVALTLGTAGLALGERRAAARAGALGRGGAAAANGNAALAQGGSDASAPGRRDAPATGGGDAVAPGRRDAPATGGGDAVAPGRRDAPATGGGDSAAPAGSRAARRPRGRARHRAAQAPLRALGGAVLAAGRVLRSAAADAERLVFGSGAARALARGGQQLFGRALGASARNPSRVVMVAGVLAVGGWVLGARTSVDSDIQRLVPQDLPALRNLQALQDATGVGGEVDVVVKSQDLTDPAVFRWMSGYQQRVLKAAGYSASRGCGTADLCPALALPDLFRGEAASTKDGIEALLDIVPSYFSQGVITKDRHTASLAFGIRFMSVARQADVIAAMRRQLNPPKGVSADLAGLPVLTAEANVKTSSGWRRTGLLLAGLLAVGLVLRLALGRWERSVVPLVPIALATGWSGLGLWLFRIELNPMSVTLSVLVVAISTEFSVLLSERFRRERAAGHPEASALARAYRSTGAAVLASGMTALAGFAVLTVSDIRMLSEFGAVTVVDLGVALLGVLLVLPAVLVLADRGEWPALPRPALRRPALRRPTLPRVPLAKPSRPRSRRRRPAGVA